MSGVNRYKYSRLNLNLDERGKRVLDTAGRLEDLSRDGRKVDMYWQEKFWIFLNFMQMMGLIWILSQQWPWPFQWLFWSRVSLLFVLDFHTWASHQDLPFSGILNVMIVFAGAGVLILSYIFVQKYVFAQEEALRRLGRAKTRFISGLTFVRVGITVGEFLYIPLALWAFRLLTCNSNNQVVELSADLECWAGGHVVLLILSSVAWLFLVAFPIVLLNYSLSASIYDDSYLHEKYIRTREIEYVLGVNDTYMERRVFVVSSYRRFFVHFKAGHCLQKLLMVAVLWGLGKEQADLQQVQAVVLLIIHGTPSVIRLFVKQYRTPSSNLQSNILSWTLVANFMVGIFSAGDTRSAFLVDSTLSVILAIINVTGVGLYALALVRSLFSSEAWPVSEVDVQRILEDDVELVHLINNTKRVLDDSIVTPAEFISQDEVDGLLVKLDRSRKSLLAAGHPLEWTIADLTEDLAFVRDNLMSRSFKQVAALKSLLLKNTGGGMSLEDSLNLRREEQTLMHPAKRKLLNRLVVARGFLGDEFMYGDRSSYLQKRNKSAYRSLTTEELQEHNKEMSKRDTLRGSVEYEEKAESEDGGSSKSDSSSSSSSRARSGSRLHSRNTRMKIQSDDDSSSDSASVGHKSQSSFGPVLNRGKTNFMVEAHPTLNRRVSNASSGLASPMMSPRMSIVQRPIVGVPEAGERLGKGERRGSDDSRGSDPESTDDPAAALAQHPSVDGMAIDSAVAAVADNGAAAPDETSSQ